MLMTAPHLALVLRRVGRYEALNAGSTSRLDAEADTFILLELPLPSCIILSDLSSCLIARGWARSTRISVAFQSLPINPYLFIPTLLKLPIGQ